MITTFIVDSTQDWEGYLWSLDPPTDNAEEVLRFLRDAAGLMPFGKRLERFMAEECGIVQSQAPDCLKEHCRQAGVPINSNTVKNWFSKAGPKKGDHSRDNMLKIAFALQLDPEQTDRLFHKVYLDRGLDPRRLEETAAAFCLQRKIGWTDYQALVQQLQALPAGREENTVYTTVLQKDIESLKTSDALQEYVRLHPHNFQIRSRSAEKVLKELVETVKGNKDKTGEIDRDIAERPESDTLLDALRNRSHYSTENMVRVITGIALPKAGKRAFLAGSILPREIRTNFPEPAVFAKEHPSYEELRKMIILLASYLCWREESRQKNLPEDFDYFEYYQARINDRLGDAGLAPLYYANPYDWLFLFAATQEDPLESFRGILDESCYQEDD